MSKVTLVKVEVEVCKESHEVFVALEQLVSDIRAKKSWAEIAAGSLGKVSAAVEGIDQLDDEIKDIHFYETAGLGGASLTRAIVNKSAVAEQAE